MLKIKKEIFDAVQYLKNNSAESLTSVAIKFGTERHTLSKYLKKDLSKVVFYEKEHIYVLFDDKEYMALMEYQDNKDITLKDIYRKYGYKSETFVKKCDVLNIPIRNRKYTFLFDFFKKINTEEKAYMLGFILADGYICEQRGELRIKLSAKDADILLKFNKALESDVPIKYLYHSTTGNKLVSISYSSREMLNDLHKYNLFANKSMQEIFYREIPRYFLKDYIRGIFDGDGFIRKNLKQIGCCGSKDVISQIILNLKNELNLNICLDTHLKYDESSHIYRCWFTGENAEKIINYLYKDSNIYLDRKYNLAKKYFK